MTSAAGGQSPVFRLGGAYWGFIEDGRLYDRHGRQMAWLESAHGRAPDVFDLAGRFLGELAEDKGACRKLFFYGGDQNIPDRELDTFFGAPLTSCWDELGKYPPTLGKRSTIDVIASYDRDGRVSFVNAHSYADRELLLATDHNLVEAEIKIIL